jgi:hypothetical protein
VRGAPAATALDRRAATVYNNYAACDGEVFRMVRHIVLFWLREKNAATVSDTLAKLNGMRGRIPGMLSLNAGADFTGSGRSCDVCLCETFESRAALEAYRTHTVNLPVQAHMHAVTERSASADYEVPEA